MSNPEHLFILKQGAKIWNKWRKENPKIIPDFQGSDISGVRLKMVNLNDANLQNAYLYEIDLGGSHLERSNLKNVDFTKANLLCANFAKANLEGAYLLGANLEWAQLQGANLQEANLIEANLQRAQLQGVNLQGAFLSDANLQEANLSGANLCNSDLQHSDLRYAQLLRAKITGVNLYGTARFGWNIEGIQCDHIFFDHSGEEKEPRSRSFEPGEFERMYKSGPTIEVVFKDGMKFFDPTILAYISEISKETKPEFGLNLQIINFKGARPSAVFERSVKSSEDQVLKFLLDSVKSLRNNNKFLQDLITNQEKQLRKKDKQLQKTNLKLLEMAATKKKYKIKGSKIYVESTHNEAHGGHQTIAQKIGKVTYKSRLGVTEQEFEQLKSDILELKMEILDEIKTILDQSKDKEGKGNSIKTILIKQGVNIANGISASALFEVIKLLVIG